MESTKTKRSSRVNERRRKKLLFYICLVLIPSLQFAVFYVYVNLNSFILAFQNYTARQGALGYDVTFAGFVNFSAAFHILGDGIVMLKNSLIWFAVKVGIGITLALTFSFYIYKKYPMSGLFKVILFMPQILSSLVFALLFRYIVTDVYLLVEQKIMGASGLGGLLDRVSTRFATTIFYNLWVGFGVNVLLFSGGMSSIDESLVESAKLDGANLLQEFFHLTIPMIWPTLVSFLIISLTGVFTDQMNLYSLFGSGSEIQTLGYYLYVNAKSADILPNANGISYSILSALGLILTIILFPITYGVRYLLNRFGPKED